MQTCTSLLPHYRSFTKQKPNSQRTTKVRLIGGCSFRPGIAVVSEMSSVSCPVSFVKVGNNASTKKRGGTRRKRSDNKCSSLNDVDGNSILPSCQVSASKACTSAYMQTNTSFKNVGRQSLPTLQSSLGNTCVTLETLPLASMSCITQWPKTVVESPSEVVKKGTRGRTSKSRSKLPEMKAVTTISRRRSSCKTATESGKSTAVKRRMRCSSNTMNDKFVESMTTFFSEVAKNMVSSCVEQTFAQLIQKGLLFSPFSSSLSVDNSTVSLLNQNNTVNNSNFDQTSSFLQPSVDSLVSANYMSSASLSNNYSFGAVQQHASVPVDFFASTQSVSPQFGFFSTQDTADSNLATCHETPLFYESATYNNFSSSFDTVGTCAGTDIGNVACYSQTVQSKNVADYSLTDLLSMSDDDIDVLLSGFVDCLSDDQLSCNTGTCLSASTNANACHVDSPVCCSDIASVTEVFDCYQKMDATHFYMGEETFQPDYFELDDDIESEASLPAVPASTSGKKITIKKPGSDSLSMSPVTRLKRPWRSCSRNDMGSSAALPVTVAVEAAVAVPSSKQPVVSEPQSQPPASDPILITVDEDLEGVGWVLLLICC